MFTTGSLRQDGGHSSDHWFEVIRISCRLLFDISRCIVAGVDMEGLRLMSLELKLAATTPRRQRGWLGRGLYWVHAQIFTWGIWRLLDEVDGERSE